MTKKKIDVLDYSSKILKALSKGVLLTVKDDEKVNTMVISWGALGIEWNHKPPLQVVVCSMPKRHYYKLEAKALQFGLPFAYSPIQLLK